MTIAMAVTIEILLPFLGFTEDNPYATLTVIIVFTLQIVTCSSLFAWYFASPLWSIQKWIQHLTTSEFDKDIFDRKIYNKNGKIKLRYLIYKNIIVDLGVLHDNLQATEQHRKKIDEAKLDWIAGISHDLKTPLTYINGYSTLLLNPSYEWSTEEQQTFIGEIADKGQHIEELINDLQHVALIDSPEQTVPIFFKTEDIVTFIQGVLEDFKMDPRYHDTQIIFEAEIEMLNIQFDPVLLQRAIQNILVNTIVHNPPKTTITFFISQLSSNEIVLKIDDDGIGMDKETIDQLFTKYYRGTTTTSKSSGTGLGLAIAYRFIQAHNGRIQVKSTLNSGTTFLIYLQKN
ncbi:sensor histidine kinase [Solibacillus cecembensis]|uniref:sensor histidine kinase n=1 Tax=Solibacillus cecembensis TaxID=459347 RepID=UPI003D01DFB2